MYQTPQVRETLDLVFSIFYEMRNYLCSMSNKVQKNRVDVFTIFVVCRRQHMDLKQQRVRLWEKQQKNVSGFSDLFEKGIDDQSRKMLN